MSEPVIDVGFLAYPETPDSLISRDVFTGSGVPTATGVPDNSIYFDTDTGDCYQWDGEDWNLLFSGGGGGGGSTEVYALSGSTSPSATPSGGAGVAYNVAGSVWVYSGGAWVKIIN